MALSALAKKLYAEGVDVVTLTAGEPDFPTPFHIKEAAKKAIEENKTKYTQNAGIPELREAIAEKFAKDNNLHFDPAQILVSNGAKHSLYNGLKAICNQGDEVIIPAPYWVSYPQMVTLVGATPVIVRTKEENEFKITPDELHRAITTKTKALLFCTPSNPTGSVYSQKELEDLGDVVRKHEIYVLSDEIYEKVIYDDALSFQSRLDTRHQGTCHHCQRIIEGILDDRMADRLHGGAAGDLLSGREGSKSDYIKCLNDFSVCCFSSPHRPGGRTEGDDKRVPAPARLHTRRNDVHSRHFLHQTKRGLLCLSERQRVFWENISGTENGVGR